MEEVIEAGRGSKGSIFVKGGKEYRALKVGRTLGGMQIWEIKYGNMIKRVYLKSRKELKEVIKGL
jgi:hypothetical protein